MLVRSKTPGSCLSDFSFFFSSRRRHTRCLSDWSSDVCSSDLERSPPPRAREQADAKARGTQLRGVEDIAIGEPSDGEIGRASCRERMEISEDAGNEEINKKTKSCKNHDICAITRQGVPESVKQ